MKRLGIIGGLGPMATAYLMEQIIKMTDASCDQEHIEMVVFNIPTIPDRTSYILDNSQDNPLLPMTEVAKALEDNSCDIVAMPCITAHFFHDDLEKAVTIPLIHGIRECALYLKERGISSVGVMATDGTIQSDLFANIFREYGLLVHYPDSVHQKYVMNIIYDNVKAGKPIEMDKFNSVSENLKNLGSEVIILGCTELSIVKKEIELGHGFLDVIDIISKCSVESCGKLKDEYKELIT